MTGPLVVSDEVSAAVRAGRPVVALESTILAHGLPRGENRRVAAKIEAAVRANGAVPATIARAMSHVTKAVLPWQDRSVGRLDETVLLDLVDRSIA